MKGKALRRALGTTDCIRINSSVPAITDTTELIDATTAQALLERNHHNRPINWHAVEEYAAIMRRGEWKLHPQGIILDPSGNILTGQTRLWAVVYADVQVYLRISRGSPADTASVIDRGRPQTARDLSSRKTERKHSPTESSIARCVCVLRGEIKPSSDDIAAILVEKNQMLREVLKKCAGAKKDKGMLMILGAIVQRSRELEESLGLISRSCAMRDELESHLAPYSARSCWGKGASFGMAMKCAQDIVRAAKAREQR